MIRQAAKAGDPYITRLFDWRLFENPSAASELPGPPPDTAVSVRHILMTSLPVEDLRQEAGLPPFDAILYQPFGLASLAAAIARAHEPSGAVPPEREKTGRLDFVGARVLVVEDHPLNREIMTEYLNLANVRVLVAENGEEALEVLEREDVDLVLMDIQMPGMDGLEATRRIRVRDTVTPILAMTAHAMSGDRDLSLDAGMNDHLTKPIQPDELYRVLRQWLPHTRDRNVAPSSPPAPSSARELPREQAPPGLMIDKALDRLGGNEAFYIKLLHSFRKDLADARDALAKELEQDEELARRRVHTLKGLAGTLGAETLRKATQDLERDWDGPQASVRAEAMLREIVSLMGALDDWLPKVLAPRPTLRAGTLAEWENLMTGLVPCLRRGDVRGVRLILREIEALHWPDVEESQQKLCDFIRKYQYEQALGFLQQHGHPHPEKVRYE